MTKSFSPRFALLAALALGTAACGGQSSTAKNGNDSIVSGGDQNLSVGFDNGADAGNAAEPALPASTNVSNAASGGDAPLASKTPSAQPTSCEAEIGRAAAQKLADQCRNVSPATHPPCNVANSCALIKDEIARGCALLGDEAVNHAACRPGPFSPGAAADAVRRYYQAIDAQDYSTAWTMWEDNGAASGKSAKAFANGFAKTRRAHVDVGDPGRIEGAAGSIYVTVPVTVDATLDDGTQQHFTGKYVLRQVDGPNGPGRSQGWHIHSANLKKAG